MCLGLVTNTECQNTPDPCVVFRQGNTEKPVYNLLTPQQFRGCALPKRIFLLFPECSYVGTPLLAPQLCLGEVRLLIYRLMDCFIPEGGVKLGHQIYTKMNWSETRGGGGDHTPTSSLSSIRSLEIVSA